MAFPKRPRDRVQAFDPPTALFSFAFRTVPILLKEAVELLQDGWDNTLLAKNKRKYVDRLVKNLLFNRQTVIHSISTVVRKSCCEIDQTSLANYPFACLKNKHIMAEIESYLGQESYAAWIGHLQSLEEILEEVGSQLRCLVPSYQGDPNDLIGIRKANEMGGKHKMDIIARLKAALTSTEMKASFEELDLATRALSTFSGMVVNDDASVNLRQSPSAVKLAKAFRRIQNSSKNLCAAFSRCCIGTCHNEHDVHVLLEDRFDLASKSPGLFFKNQRNEGNEAVLAFQLIFGAKAVTPAQTRYHELSVRCIEEDESVGSPHELGSKPSRVTFSEPEHVASKDAGFVPVPNFCTAIATAHGGAQHVTFILHTSKGMGTVTAEKKTIKEKDACQTITLQDFISASKEITLPWKSRMMLASKVASSLLQFSQTRWHSQALSKGSISFLLHPKSSDAAPLADFERPFVRAKIDGEDVSGEGNVEPRSILLELGILLLEIWYQTGLEDRFNDRTSHMSASFHSRLSLAIQWLDDEYSLPLELYEDAVRFCIRGASDKCWTDWNSTELWNEICKEVIEPLSNFCRQRLTGRVSNGN